MRHLITLLVFLLIFSCKEEVTVEKEVPILWEPYNDSC